MTIERPMFPPRAESVDSFSLQPAIGQRERENRISESRKPAEGLSRRAHTYDELESQVTECFLQAEVAAIVVHDTLSARVTEVTADQAMAVTHAVYQLVADVRTLRAQYFGYLESDTKAVQA
jgi:hypothetical protein